MLMAGCGPKYTYPADGVPKSVEKICKDEYKITVQARVAGKTLGALFVIGDILDAQGQILKEVNEQMGKVMQVVTRVALSTDLPLDFCTVVIRDKEHGNELSITRSLDDTKRANADVIGIEESINRTVFSQAKSEPEVPGAAEAFLLKEITLEDFLAAQIAQRIRFHFSKDAREEAPAKGGSASGGKEEPELLAGRALLLVDGAFDRNGGQKSFRFSVLALKADDPRQSILGMFKMAAEVLKAYRFTAYDSIEIQDYLNRQKLAVPAAAALDYLDKKLTDDELLAKYLTESKSMQEAFKLFGFNMPQEPVEEAPALVAATP